jgi:hypothetical protein
MAAVLQRGDGFGNKQSGFDRFKQLGIFFKGLSRISRRFDEFCQRFRPIIVYRCSGYLDQFRLGFIKVDFAMSSKLKACGMNLFQVSVENAAWKGSNSCAACCSVVAGFAGLSLSGDRILSAVLIVACSHSPARGPASPAIGAGAGS